MSESADDRTREPAAVDETTTGVVDAVDFVARTLGVPERDVLRGTGVDARTFSTWKRNPGREPRLASHDGLWKYVQVCEDLAEVLGSGCAAWVTASEQRHKMIVEGEIDRLLVDALAPAERPAHRNVRIPDVGPDVAIDVVPRTRPARASKARPAVVRRPGQTGPP